MFKLRSNKTFLVIDVYKKPSKFLWLYQINSEIAVFPKILLDLKKNNLGNQSH